ncbi:transmembrane efflux protein (MFS) [Arthrobacter crystallopoietes BAB-32]|uniref:Transmembrane efflux protein (MFS) n=1 Tax=Arthrobacter crystallopoietes BAB-32 TaxID=1246476 RepID=N1UZ63_9MICC|nr:MFS transporter [Arthrobacter crystallopoietes]EMY33122.1 transmembrane efflux protein (MFS) [Arthrobacter crystallopoietes BAB-32]
MPLFRRSASATGAAGGTREKAVLSPIPRDIKVLIAAAFVIALGYGIVAPVLPQFAASFDVGVAAASIIVSVFAFMRLVFAPAGGALVGKWGERRVYLVGLLIVAISTGACAVAQDYWQLLLFRGLGGAGSTMFTVSAAALILRLAPPDSRGRVSGAYASTFLMGGILGPVVGGLLAGFGLRMPFVVYAVALLIAAAVVAIMLKKPSAATGDEVAVPEPMDLREALADPGYRAAVVSAFANGWATFGVRMALIPLFAAAVLGAGPETAGLALAVFAVGNALALTFSGRLSDSVGRRPLVIAGLVVAGLSIAAIGFTDSIPLFVAASVTAGFGSGLLGPAQQAAVADIIGSSRSGGKVLAVFQMATDGGAIIGPVLAGALADRIGYDWAFAVTGAVALAAALLWKLFGRETLAKPAQPDG